MSVTIDPEFAQHFLNTINDPGRHGVHLLFNRFWGFAPDEVRAAYVQPFLDDPMLQGLIKTQHYPEPLTIDRLAAAPAGSLGEAAHTFIDKNGLEQNLATNYRAFHDMLADAGMLDGMPEELRYAILRGFQLHDMIHVVTGYGPNPRGEIALQAFCLAQLQFPYFAMWMAVITTRMTFIDPRMIVPMMDAICDGWSFGRSVPNIQFERWEEHLDEPLGELRQKFGIMPAGRGALVTAGV